MKRILIPSSGPCQWRTLLRDPATQWKRKKSAFEVAVSWERAQMKSRRRGLPTEIAAAIDGEPALSGANLFFALPEHKVPLNDWRAPSQNDVWALLKHPQGFISLAVEGKAGEPFDETVSEWRKKTKGWRARLDWLCKMWLNSDKNDEKRDPLRYQLFHRTASPLIEANNSQAFAAVMIVQSFAEDDKSRKDFKDFVTYLGALAEDEGLVAVPTHDKPKLFLGWVSCKPATDAEVAASVSES